MITQGSKLSIRRIPIERLIVQEAKPRYTSMVMLYVDKMRSHPHDEPGMIRVKPVHGYPGLFVIDDGHHRYVASIIVGRKDMLCIVIEEPS